MKQEKPGEDKTKAVKTKASKPKTVRKTKAATKATAPGAAESGLVQLKIELRDTDIKRTIIIPEDISLDKCASVVMGVFGWHGGHLWEYNRGRYNRYAIPDGFDADFEDLGVTTHDATKITVGEVLKEAGDKIVFGYDSGDGWEHIITRMAKPKFDSPCCCSRQGTMGIDDIGGPWRLKEFTEKMLKYETSPASKRDKEFRKELEWYGFGTKERRIEFLNGPDCVELSRILLSILKAKV